MVRLGRPSRPPTIFGTGPSRASGWIRRDLNSGSLAAHSVRQGPHRMQCHDGRSHLVVRPGQFSGPGERCRISNRAHRAKLLNYHRRSAARTKPIHAVRTQDAFGALPGVDRRRGWTGGMTETTGRLPGIGTRPQSALCPVRPTLCDEDGQRRI